MNLNQKQIISHVMISFIPGAIISEDAITNLVNVFSSMYPITVMEKAEVVKTLHTRLAIRMDRGSCVKEKDHITWYYSAKKDLKTEYWDRYKTYLINEVGFSQEVINSLDASTDEMMDSLGNPSLDNDFQRRGLVIGDIQSGKTATYAALINKAADSAYRIIIVLTGTIEKLRKQTQSRLDEGFVGLDSTAFINDRSNVLVGVGNIDPSITGWAITSTTSDFRQSTAERLGGRLDAISSPVLFVLKKNKSVLEKLEQWLKLYNANQVSQKCPLPMLMIDDEADSASVNTRTDEDPTTINENIRKLLTLFSKANYVGFTATPFANIFINPDSNEEMLGDDLFPRDFIYALEAPSNYVGARSVFSENGKHSYMLKLNDDCEEYLPEKHKIGDLLREIPPSLKKAIASFFIANAVRDLRGNKNTHRSMLINVSRFIAIQNQVEKAVDGYVRELQREIKNYYLIGSEALDYESFSFIKSVFDNNFSNQQDFEFSWEEIQQSLHQAVASIVTRTVNGGNASKNLNYDEFKEDGLRIIAVGGLSLSRGLTLEGLCVSYFYRNSKMYDTIMQMGRWFGYRDDYADICQIWMSDEAVGWYESISEASDDLRHEVMKMQAQNKTPKEFGLYVRYDKDTLMVSARNKMKHAKDYIKTVSLNGDVVETPYIHLDKQIVTKNLDQINYWAKLLNDAGYTFEIQENLALRNFQILNLPKKHICELLNLFNSHSLNIYFNTKNLVEMINNSHDGTMDKWDVVIAKGDGNPIIFCGLDIKPVQRKFRIREDSKAIQMSGKNSRLGDASLAKGGLTKEQVEEIENRDREYYKTTGRAFSQKTYFNSGIKRNPLLVIYPIELTNSEDQDLEKKQKAVLNFSSPVIGLSMGIPSVDGRESKKINIKMNLILQKQLLEVDQNDEDFEERDEMLDQEEGVINNV